MTPTENAQRTTNESHPGQDTPEQKTSSKRENGDKGAHADEGDDSPKKGHKRRKVNHACVYCRRSHMTCDLERPCARCIKRDIGHLCHDEPREPTKRSKSEVELAPATDKTEPPTTDPRLGVESYNTYEQDDGSLTIGPAKLPDTSSALPTIAQPKPMSPATTQKQSNNGPAYMNFDEWDFGMQGEFPDLNNLHPYNTFNTQEVTNEYNLLGNFLSTSLIDDGAMFNGDDAQALFSDPLLTTGAISTYANNGPPSSVQGGAPQPDPAQLQAGIEISRPSSAFPADAKAREKFYMTAADPAGNDTPEERMNKLLKAKYEAGLLKPFNYVKGYARLNHYMERNMRPTSRQKILRQLNNFRPKFREAMHNLTDMQLVKVEMAFERGLMQYDRVFASMAIPACCWRRTGEIFRGNKEMAELIHVPVEQLRDGKLAIHEIIVEESLVSYWEEFGKIAFDQSQKAILTSCSLKNPDQSSKDPMIKCCFSFTIRRDTHNIPSVIVGNFIPMRPG